MSSDRRTGFALPAVLTVTGVVTLVFLVAITALTSLTREARSTRERVRFLENALTAEATIQFLAATEPFDNRGLNIGGPQMRQFGEEPPMSTSGSEVSSVRLDGRSYLVSAERPNVDPVLVSLQDQAGMVNLATIDAEQFERLGALLGVSASLARTLKPLYTDYVDADDLETLNGAESTRYRNGGPANRPMLRPSEFLSMLGVREAVSSRKWRDLAGDLTVDPRRTTINVNTATPQTLKIVFGVTEREMEAAVRARDAAPFLSLSDFIAASGSNVVEDFEQVFTFPSGAIIYTIQDTRSAWRYRARLVLTPASTEQPFWVDQTGMTEAVGTAMASGDADRFPYTPR